MNYTMSDNKLIIEPGVGIGTIKLGMSKKEIEHHINHYKEKYENRSYRDEHGKELYYGQIFESGIKIEYGKQGTVIFIEIVRELMTFFDCICYDIDMFRTKAEEVVRKLSDVVHCEAEMEDETECTLENVGLSLWRPHAFDEADMQEDWFQEMCEENQEEEKRYMYFQTVAVYPNDGLYYQGLLSV